MTLARTVLNLCGAMLLIAATAQTAPALAVVTSPMQQALEVFPGDQFYIEGEQIEVPVLELEKPFQGRMPGSMHIPFSFAIDATTLRLTSTRDGWNYFSAAEGSARAWHGLLGNVLVSGDTVGVRVRASDGVREWYVDNSRYNGMNTIWHRRVTTKDVAVSDRSREKLIRPGSTVRLLEYMGVRDGQVRIRYKEVQRDGQREDEFYFKVEEPLPMQIGIKGLRAEILKISSSSANIKVLRGFDGPP